MAKIKICVEPDCKNVQTTESYCRLHYLKNWKAIRETAQKKAAERLNKYVDGICKKYPDKYVDMIRREIKTGKGDFQNAGEEAPVDEFAEGFSENLGFHDDESLDKLLSRIKIDKDY